MFSFFLSIVSSADEVPQEEPAEPENPNPDYVPPTGK